MRDLGEYEEVVWFADVPEVPGSRCVTHPLDRGADSEWIAVERPRIPPRPVVPELLWGWLENDEFNDETEPRLRGLTDTEVMPEAVLTAFESYITAIRQWATEHATKLPVLGLYERLFRMKQLVDQQPERYEIVAGLGLALVADSSHPRVRRHLLSMRGEFQYDMQTGRIAVHGAADGLDLQFEDDMLDPSLVPAKGVRDAALRSLIGDADAIWTTAPAALETWTNDMRHDARFVADVPPPPAPDSGLLVAFAPALILRKRTLRTLIAFYRGLDAQLQSGTSVPGLVAPLVAEPEGRAAVEGEPWTADEGELYFPRPHNREQLEVLRRLEAGDGVVVVGPPGTGKSHTIANLVAHLLANGQRVLVTSHTSRALEVLLDKLPEDIRRLSVSLVGDGRAGMRELQRSVDAIVQRSADGDWSIRAIDERIERLRRSRELAEQERREGLALIRRVRETDAQEHDLGFGGYNGTLSAIARRVSGERIDLGWAEGMPAEPQLSSSECLEWLELAGAISSQDEQLALEPIPHLESVPPDAFERMCRRVTELETIVKDAEHLGGHPAAEALRRASSSPREALIEAIETLDLARQRAAAGEPWELQALEEVLSGRGADWRARLTQTNEALASLRSVARVVDRMHVDGQPGISSTIRVRAAVGALVNHLLRGGGWGFGPFRPAAVRQAKIAMGTLQVDGQTPSSLPALEQLLTWLDYQMTASRATADWAGWRDLSVTTPLALVAHLEELSSAASRVVEADVIRRNLEAAVGHLAGVGRPGWQDALAWSELKRAAQAVNAVATLQDAVNDLRAFRADVASAGTASDGLTADSLAAIDDRDPANYEVAYRESVRRAAVRDRVARRDALAARLESAVPGLELGEVLADEATWRPRLAKFEQARDWARADAWLRASLDASTGGTAARISTLTEQIRATTATIGEHLAWKACLSGLTRAQSMHLTLYQLAMRKYGKGTGKYAATHLAAAQRELEECRDAVPAWIMPTFRVAESLRANAQPFDVVIVDEASQSGIDALFLWWLGRKVVIVGDDEQISPDAVGLDQEPFFALRRELLGDAPIGNTISPTTSLFDLGQAAFPGKLYLREHFRCMPEIIAFSNRISYSNSPLIPLRQFGADRLPPLVEKFVEGAVRTDGARASINREEAHAVVETMAAAVEDPAYAGRSMGVVSLTGEWQARHIERLLLQRLGPDELLRRNLKCGDAYAFQGDERDVMFLSMVAVPSERGNRLPALTGNQFRQRFNVAASRARDQMVLFHSVTPDDLNPVCLRAQLLEHFLRPPDAAATPDLGVVTEAERHPAFDSLFEQRVYLRIRARGFRVHPQFSAYGYRIDLVVVGDQNRLAVECDGDEWHGPEAFEGDLARQRDLERVGWRFVRIRESEFYLDPEVALQPLWSRLAEAGIQPGFGSGVVAEPPGPAPAVPALGESESVVRALLEPFVGVHEPTEAPQRPEAIVDGAPPVHGAPTATGAIAASGAGDPAVTTIPGNQKPLIEFQALSPTPQTDESTAPPKPYVQWQSRPLPDPRAAGQSALVAALVEVVRAEGPILAHRAYRLIVQASGGQRLTHAAVSPLNKASAEAVRQAKLISESSGRPGLINNILRAPDQPPVVVRARGPRGLEEIPSSEIQEVARRLRSRRPSLVGESLKRAILEAYDRVALTSAAERYLDDALRGTQGDEPATPEVKTATGTASPSTVEPSGAEVRPLRPATPSVVDGDGRSARPDFVRVLAGTITRARSLPPAARAVLASRWQDDELAHDRARVVEVAATVGAPRDWSTAARAVTASLEDWPASGRGAVVDAAYAQLVSDRLPEPANGLLAPWLAALDARISGDADVRASPDVERCPHGRPMAMCPYITCKGHFLGGISLDEN